MSKLLSVILPTYNVRPYLGQCLESIIAQTYRNIEIIVVIDGATDGSYELAKEYAEKDKRIRVVWQENAGSGPARNKGLEYVSGDYVMFVDPDDWLADNMIESYMAVCDKADMIVGGSTYHYQNDTSRNKENKRHAQQIEGEKNIRGLYLKFLSQGYLGAPTNKLFRMDIIRKYHITFPDLRRSQDIVFNYRYYSHISSLCVIEDIGYYYRIVEEIQNLKLKKDYYQTLSLIYSEIIQLHQDWNVEIDPGDYSAMCSYFLPSVMANIEANIVRKESIRPIMKDENIRKIIKGASETRMDRKVFRFLFCIHCGWGVKLLMKLRLAMKKRDRRGKE